MKITNLQKRRDIKMTNLRKGRKCRCLMGDSKTVQIAYHVNDILMLAWQTQKICGDSNRILDKYLVYTKDLKKGFGCIDDVGVYASIFERLVAQSEMYK